MKHYFWEGWLKRSAGGYLVYSYIRGEGFWCSNWGDVLYFLFGPGQNIRKNYGSNTVSELKRRKLLDEDRKKASAFSCN